MNKKNDKIINSNFQGFSAKTINFLKKIQNNNNKDWFEKHRSEYENHLLGPMRDLVTELGPFMLGIDPYFEIRPSVNKTISRIFRDIRFSKDKSPLRDEMWITFKRPTKKWHDFPGFFFEISPDSYLFGMGFFSASRDTMDRLREIIDDEPDKFKKNIAFIKKQNLFKVEGEKYKRIIDKSKSGEMLEWYQRKNIYLICNRENDKILFEKNLLTILSDGFKSLAPFYRFLCSLKE